MWAEITGLDEDVLKRVYILLCVVNGKQHPNWEKVGEKCLTYVMTGCKEGIILSFTKKKIKLLHSFFYELVKEIKSTIHNINAKKIIPI